VIENEVVVVDAKAAPLEPEGGIVVPFEVVGFAVSKEPAGWDNSVRFEDAVFGDCAADEKVTKDCSDERIAVDDCASEDCVTDEPLDDADGTCGDENWSLELLEGVAEDVKTLDTVWVGDDEPHVAHPEPERVDAELEAELHRMELPWEGVSTELAWLLETVWEILMVLKSVPRDIAELAWETLEATEEANDDVNRTPPDEDPAIDDTEDTATDDVQPSEEPDWLVDEIWSLSPDCEELHALDISEDETGTGTVDASAVKLDTAAPVDTWEPLEPTPGEACAEDVVEAWRAELPKEEMVLTEGADEKAKDVVKDWTLEEGPDEAGLSVEGGVADSLIPTWDEACALDTGEEGKGQLPCELVGITEDAAEESVVVLSFDELGTTDVPSGEGCGDGIGDAPEEAAEEADVDVGKDGTTELPGSGFGRVPVSEQVA
jgi:hypothetical protein